LKVTKNNARANVPRGTLAFKKHKEVMIFMFLKSTEFAYTRTGIKVLDFYLA